MNDNAVQSGLAQLGSVDYTPLLKQFGEHMLRSKELTFRSGGSPDGSWPPLAESTLRGYSDAKRQAFVGSLLKGGNTTLRRRGQKNLVARKILINTARLKNSIAYVVVDAHKVNIGTNLVYAAIHQYGGLAGRGHKSKIPARPYLVFRPEDPAKLQGLADKFVALRVREAGLA